MKKEFSQYGMKVNEDLIVYSVKRLEGIAGWLTELGSRAVRRGDLNKEVVDGAAQMSTKVVIEDLTHFSQR
ncbi:MAG: hypothetical protein N3D12_06420 [Candidatus Methanomethyliaceae archaeon]|nr:hypothetical protein [Candidatus Methanomethyliaceae archaeon]